MRRPAAFACAALSAALLAAAAGCGASSTKRAGTPMQTQAPPRSSSTGASAQAAPLPARPGPIPAGTYVTGTFRPALRLRLPEGFELRRPEYEDLLSFVGNGGAITILDVDAAQSIAPRGALNPTRADLRPAPSDLRAWLAEHPALTLADERTVTVAGMRATEVDVRGKPPTKDVSLFYSHEVLIGQPKGARGRIVAFQAGGHTVALVILAPAARFASFTAIAQQLVSSLALAPSPPAAPAPQAGGSCGRVQTFPEVGREHVTTPPPASAYNSFPPTSGPHYPDPARWGIYDRPFQQFVLVHNLEHGGIVVQYGRDIPPATVRAIASWVSADPQGMLLAPLPELGATIALTAWTHLMECSAFDERVFSAFRDAYRYRGPELLPADTYEPKGAA